MKTRKIGIRITFLYLLVKPTYVLDETLWHKYNIIIDVLRFEWDERKAAGNITKHGISFEEDVTVFNDEYAVLFDDPDHSDEEDRFILLGISIAANILIVCHCSRENDSVIRIISARKATKKESEQYNEFRKGW